VGFPVARFSGGRTSISRKPDRKRTRFRVRWSRRWNSFEQSSSLRAWRWHEGRRKRFCRLGWIWFPPQPLGRSQRHGSFAFAGFSSGRFCLIRQPADMRRQDRHDTFSGWNSVCRSIPPRPAKYPSRRIDRALRPSITVFQVKHEDSELISCNIPVRKAFPPLVHSE